MTHFLSEPTPMILNDPPAIGTPVIYYDDGKQPFAGIVAHVFSGFSPNINRPRVNLAVFSRDGQACRRPAVEPAYHNGVTWVIINKWAYPGEIPDEEWNYLPPPTFTKRGTLSVEKPIYLKGSPNKDGRDA